MTYTPLPLPFVAGVLDIPGRTGGRYAVREFPADDCRAFRLTKPGGTETYRVCISAVDSVEDRCDCLGFTQHGRCKHVRCLRELVEKAQI